MLFASPIVLRPVVAGGLFIAILGFAGPAAPQDAQDDRAEQTKQLEAEVAEYLQKHPVKESALFDSVGAMVEVLGEVKTMTLGVCEYEADLPDWNVALGPLHENTKVALQMDFLNGGRKERERTPADTLPDRRFCAELQRRYREVLRQFKIFGPALRKAGY